MRRKKRILILGSYGSSNIGDEALLSALLASFSSFEVSVLSGNPSATLALHSDVKVFPHFPLGLRSLFRIWPLSLWQMFKADAVIFGGGGLFSDREGLKAVFLWTWHVWVSRLFLKRIYFVAQSMEPMQSLIGSWLSRWALSRAEWVSVRDTESFQLMKKLGIEDVHLGGDLSFLLDAPEQHSKKKICALNLRPWHLNISSVEPFLCHLEKKGYEILLLANEDQDFTFLKTFENKNRPLIQARDFLELEKILSSCEVALGMRLHFLIAASKSGCKVGALAYASKVQALMNELKVPFLEPKDWDEEGLTALFKNASPAQHLDRQIDRVKADVKKLKSKLSA